MITRAIKFMILCIFSFIPLLLGELASKRSIPTTEDFILQGRRMKLFPMYASVFSTWMSAFAFMGGISYFFEEGPIYMTTVGWDALFAVLFLFLGKRIWYYGKVYKYQTPTDFFNNIYESKTLNIIVTCIIILCTMMYLQAQIVGGLLIIRLTSNEIVSWYIGGILFFSILVIYLWSGGLRAVAMTDIFYGILIVLAILISGFFLINIAGGPTRVFNVLVLRDPSNVSMPGNEGLFRTAKWISLFIIVPIGAFMGPQIWIRNYSAEKAQNFNILPFLLVLSSVISIGTLFAGSASVVMAQGAADPESAFVQIMMQKANPYFFTFVIVGIYAAIFSTANSQVHAISAVITVDIFKKYINKNLPDKRLAIIAKWCVVVVSAISYFLMIILPRNIFDLTIMATGGLSQLIVPVIGALFWNKSTSTSAVSGILVGEFIFILSTALNLTDAVICAFSALLANSVTFLIVSLFGKSNIRTSRKIEIYKKDYNLRDF